MKQIIIDLCKIAFGLWFIFTGLIGIGVIDSFVSSPRYIETNSHQQCFDYEKTHTFDNIYCNNKNERVDIEWCSQDLFNNKYCLANSSSEDFYFGHFDIGAVFIPLLIINSINSILLFIVLNRKYKTFGFRTCSGNILNEKPIPNEVKHE